MCSLIAVGSHKVAGAPISRRSPRHQGSSPCRDAPTFRRGATWSLAREHQRARYGRPWTSGVLPRPPPCRCCPSSSSKRSLCNRRTRCCENGRRRMSERHRTGATRCSGTRLRRSRSCSGFCSTGVASRIDVAAADRSRARRTLLILALMCAAPVIASYLAYYWFRPSARTNYGELLDPKPTPDAVGTRLDGERFKLSELRGKWVLLAIDPSGCDDECRGKLYATRQARAIQGREQDRIVRVWVQGVDAPAPASDLLEQHPGLIVARVDAAQWALLPEAAM